MHQNHGINIVLCIYKIYIATVKLSTQKIRFKLVEILRGFQGCQVHPITNFEDIFCQFFIIFKIIFIIDSFIDSDVHMKEDIGGKFHPGLFSHILL